MHYKYVLCKISSFYLKNIYCKQIKPPLQFANELNVTKLQSFLLIFILTKENQFKYDPKM